MIREINLIELIELIEENKIESFKILKDSIEIKSDELLVIKNNLDIAEKYLKEININYDRESKILSIYDKFVFENGNTIAVTLTCHEAYSDWLEETILSIDKNNPDQKIVCLDDINIPDWLKEKKDWEIITGKWGTPIPARNLALNKCKTSWQVGWDTDNYMPEGFIDSYRRDIKNSNSKVAFIYSDIQYTDSNLNPTKLRIVPEWNYDLLRENNFLDTSACWRIDALRSIGGYLLIENCDDWIVSLKLSSKGWCGKHSSAPSVLMREHERGRRSIISKKEIFDVFFKCRSFGIVTCLAPNRKNVQKLWVEWINNAILPNFCSLYIVDNTNDKNTHKWLLENIDLSRFESFSYSKVSDICQPGWYGIHRLVSKLYLEVIPRVVEDFIFTLEDDVLPPLTAIYDLHKSIADLTDIGAVGGLYETPEIRGKACAARALDAWQDIPNMDELYGVIEVGFVGGGCTLYPRYAINKIGGFNLLDRSVEPLGWDANVCRMLREIGYKILLDANVLCKHNTHGQIL